MRRCCSSPFKVQLMGKTTKARLGATCSGHHPGRLNAGIRMCGSTWPVARLRCLMVPLSVLAGDTGACKVVFGADGAASGPDLICSFIWQFSYSDQTRCPARCCAGFASALVFISMRSARIGLLAKAGSAPHEQLTSLALLDVNDMLHLLRRGRPTDLDPCRCSMSMALVVSKAR